MTNNTPKWEETLDGFFKDYKIELSEKFTNQDDKELLKHFIHSLLARQAQEIEQRARKETLKELMVEFNENQLEGKGYDFYFVIRNKLDDTLTAIKQVTNKY